DVSLSSSPPTPHHHYRAMLPTPPPSPKLHVKVAPEDRLGHLLLDRISLDEVLGVGAYGVVYKAVDVQTGTLYAVKALTKHGLDRRQRKFQQREIQLHQRASAHPNVLSMLKVLDDQDCTYVILEYCSDGDLFVNITDRGRYAGNDFLAKSVFLQILDAVEHCHSQNIFHRDLKPENILVSEHGTSVKLADFGLATTDGVSFDFGCGSTFYMSPECQDPRPKPFSGYASAPNDVWSLGVILVNLACGRNPWKRASPDDSTFAVFLRNRNFLKTILPITDDLNLILRAIFECDPSKRISIPVLRQMILACPALTVNSSSPEAPSSPVSEPEDVYESQYSPSWESSPEPEEFHLAPEVQNVAGSPLYYGAHLPSNQQQYSPPSPYYSSPAPPSPQTPLYYEPPRQRQPTPPPPQQQPPHSQSHTLSATAAPFQSSWYMHLIPALDLAQKHLSFHPLLPDDDVTSTPPASRERSGTGFVWDYQT
ncbi:MAG: hypothetical protein Q9159_007684, partial [Coniocarpon cinnabarinum]